jgi:predicted nucleic acid-binding protein
MRDNAFMDTNVLVYAHDTSSGAKHAVARKLVHDCWQTEPFPWLSVQVLQELFVTLVRKGVPLAEARKTMEDYTCWRLVENDATLLQAGMDEMERWNISFWDALILAAARSAGSPVIYSEDLSHTQDYDGIRVVNPFAAP